jgi:hypothetical protein
MNAARRAIAASSRSFGRGPAWEVAPVAAVPQRSTVGDDLKLFLTTFAAGFVFVSVLIA